MSCEHVVLVGGGTAIVCSRRARPRGCKWCGLGAVFACDAQRGNGSRTCSAPMRARHATEVGPATHHCPEHRAVLGLFDGR